MLTGESLPVRKHVDSLVLETVLADRKNLAFAGTLVTRGEAKGVVCATGDQSETGQDRAADFGGCRSYPHRLRAGLHNLAGSCCG